MRKEQRKKKWSNKNQTEKQRGQLCGLCFATAHLSVVQVAAESNIAYKVRGVHQAGEKAARKKRNPRAREQGRGRGGSDIDVWLSCSRAEQP